MVEIAICLAIIGIALVSIIGVLPSGMHTQRDNREETIINQDATVLMEAIRNGMRGLDDLTNYVYAITNSWAWYVSGVSNKGGVNGYFATNFYIAPGYYSSGSLITNGANIVGLLSAPEYTDPNGQPISSITNVSYYSNHIVAYVRSLSGPAIEKPPQDNDIVVGDSFGYRVLCVNAPVAKFEPTGWSSQPYNQGVTVSYPLNGQVTYWQSTANTLATDQPGVPGVQSAWARVLYPEVLGANLHELRLTFFWPQLPNGNLGSGRQSFRTLVAGQVLTTNINGQVLYFYQPQSFVSSTNAP